VTTSLKPVKEIMQSTEANSVAECSIMWWLCDGSNAIKSNRFLYIQY